MKNVTLTILLSLLTLPLFNQQSEIQEEPMDLEKESESFEQAINHWDILPSELKLHILSYLRIDDLEHLLFTNHDFKDHALDPIALKSFIHDLFYRPRSDWMERSYYHISGAFFGLIEQGNKRLVEVFLKVKPKIVDEVLDYHTPLITAIKKGQRPIVELLLDCGANVNKPELLNEHYIPLKVAIMKGYKLIAQLLITHGAQVNEPEADLNPLYAALKRKDKGMVELLLANDANPNLLLYAGGNPIGATPLFALLTEQRKRPYSQILKLLLEAGANLNEFLRAQLLKNATQSDDLETIELIKYHSKECDLDVVELL